MRLVFILLLFIANAANSQPIYDGPVEVKIHIGTFLGNEHRNYYGNQAPDTLSVIWKHYLGKGKTIISRKSGERIWAGAGWTGQPLLVEEDGQLFLIQGAYDHHLKKINADNGELIWQYAFDDVVKGTGTIWHNSTSRDPEMQYIIMQGSRLGVGNYLDTKHVPSFRAISLYNGNELWRMDVKWTDSYSRDADGSALVINDTAYAGLENSLFTVFDPDPAKASQKDGMLQPFVYSETKLYKQEDVTAHRYNVVTESSPSKLGNHIYIASGSGHVWGYNLDTRELDWDFPTGSDMDGSVIVTSDSCLLVSVEKQYIPGQGGAFKLDPKKDPENSVIWYYPSADKDYASWKGGIIGSIGITDNYNTGLADNLAAFAAIDGYLYIVRHQLIDADKRSTGPDGKTSYPMPVLQEKIYIGPSISTPIFVEDRLIAAGYNGLYLFSVDKEMTISRLDHFAATFESTPITWDGKIYLASRNGYLYCFGSD